MEPLITRRSTYTLLILGFIVSALLFSISAVRERQEIREQAVGTTSLSLVPSHSTISAGEEVDISVTIDTGSNIVSAADIIVNFDTSDFEGISFTKGSFLPNLFGTPSIQGNTARIQLHAPGLEEKQGSGVLAVLRLRAKRTTSSSVISFASGTAIAALNEDTNVVTSMVSATLVVSEQPQTVTPDTRLYIIPASITVNPGDTLYMPVHIDSGNNKVAAVDLIVSYDNNKLEGRNITPGGYLPSVLLDGSIGNGVAKIILGTSPDNPRQGTGVVAVLEFKARDNYGTSTVVLDGATRVSTPLSDVNIVKRLESATVSVGSLTASPSPSPSGTCVVPAAPTGVFATALNTSQVELSWSGNSDATYYGIVYGTRSRVYTFGAANVGSTNSFTISGLSVGTRYYFAVFASAPCGSSGYSGEASTVTTGNTGGSTTYVAPRATPYSGGESTFTPIDPNSDAGQFGNHPIASVSPAPEVIIPYDYQSEDENQSFLSFLFTPLRIAIGAFLLLLLLGILLLRKKN